MKLDDHTTTTTSTNTHNDKDKGKVVKKHATVHTSIPKVLVYQSVYGAELSVYGAELF